MVPPSTEFFFSLNLTPFQWENTFVFFDSSLRKGSWLTDLISFDYVGKGETKISMNGRVYHGTCVSTISVCELQKYISQRNKLLCTIYNKWCDLLAFT